MLSTVIHRAISHPLSFISSACIYLIRVICISSTKITILKMVNLGYIHVCKVSNSAQFFFNLKNWAVVPKSPTKFVWWSDPISQLEWSISSYLNPRLGLRLRLVYASCFFLSKLDRHPNVFVMSPSHMIFYSLFLWTATEMVPYRYRVFFFKLDLGFLCILF